MAAKMSLDEIKARYHGPMQILKEDQEVKRHVICRCICGKELSISNMSLIHRQQKSCRQCTDVSRRMVSPGQKFGKWTVLQKVERTGSTTYMMCRCECGVEQKITSQNLRNGRSTQCRKCRNKETRDMAVGYVDGYGYRRIQAYGVPGIKDGNSVLEHRAVMAKHRNEPLLPTQEVHHGPKGKLCNDIDNLELWDTSHPKGQRVEDLIEFSIKILLQYRPELLKCHSTNNP